MAVRDDSKERELDTFPASDAADLFKFNIRQQRIVDLCNAEFDEDWSQDPMHYSTFQRALKGNSAWIEVVQALDNLLESQKASPRRYLPKDDPPDAEALGAWMKQIAGAPWWHMVSLENNVGRSKRQLMDLLHSHDATDEQIEAARVALDEAGDVFRRERVRIRREPL